MARRWTRPRGAAWWRCVTASWGRAGDSTPIRCRAAATASGLSSRDPEQNRDELVDLAHLVEEVVGAGLHAALAHRRQVVVGEHDDPDVAAVLGILVLVPGAGLADHADAAAR